MSTKTQEGVNCVLKIFAKFSQTVVAPIRIGRSSTQQIAKTLRNEINKEHTIFNLEPIQGKKPRPTHVGFSHNPLNGQPVTT